MARKWMSLILAVCLMLGVMMPAAFADETKTFIVAMTEDPKSFNPDAQADDSGWPVFQNLYDGLFQLNWNNEIVPDLCETYTISDDGLTYTFNLRKGVKWHDGEAFSSADVEFTYKMIMENSGIISQELNNSVAEMSCPDDDTFVMTLKAPNAPILGTLAWYANFILPKHLYEGVEDWKTCEAATTNPVGTGAYKFVSYDRGVSIVLEKNPDYHLGAPQVDRLIFQVIPDSDTAMQAFFNGEIDMLKPVPNSQVPALLKDPQYKLGYSSAARRYQIAMNMESEKMTLAVRQAVALSIDREEISRKATNGLMPPAYGFYPPYCDWAYNADADIGERDVAKARQILEDAGFTADENGNYIELEMLVLSSGSYADCGKVMQSNLKEAGINMKLTVLESAAWHERVTSGDFDMAMLNGYQGPDPDAMSKRIGTGGAANYSHFSNAEVDELLAKARSLTDNEARGACYRRIQEIEAEELPIIPVVEMATYYICRSNVSGIAYIDHVSDVSDNSYARVTID